jgi:import inner membrane translocase subunit TIM44
VGARVKAAKAKVSDKVEDAREVWETSQHPLVVNASFVVDSVLAETEQAKALREIQQLDAGFDQYSFVKDMQEQLIPSLARAFFSMDMEYLGRTCRESAMAQVKAVQAAREVEGLWMDGTILQVQRTEIQTARSLEKGLPVILVSAQVQYIHAVKNKKDEVVEGSESEIRAAFFVLAVTREYDPATSQLEWKVMEMSMQGSMLYL